MSAPYLWLILHDLAYLTAGVYLVTHDYPWWGGLCLALAAATTVTRKNPR